MARQSTADYLTELGDYGIELEISDLNRNNPDFVNEFNENFASWKREHDASCETPTLTIKNIPVTFSDDKSKDLLIPLINNSELLIGGEIVSPVVSRAVDFKNTIYSLCDLLWRCGENSKGGNTRDSLHVHINVGKTIPLYKIINLLKLHSAYEAILYRLGGMGKVNRGDINSYIFMRPYLGNSAPCVRVGKNTYPIFNYDDLINASTKEDFFNKLGDTIYHANNNTRYVTHRYMGLNFYCIPVYGTVEFRHCNKTLVPEWILSWVNLCKAFVNVCDSPKLSVDIKRPLYENREISEDEFMTSLNIFELPTEDKVNLLDIWTKSPTPQYDNLWRFSHLDSPTFFRNIYMPDVLDNSISVKIAENIHYRSLQDALRNDIRVRCEKAIRANRAFNINTNNILNFRYNHLEDNLDEENDDDDENLLLLEVRPPGDYRVYRRNTHIELSVFQSKLMDADLTFINICELFPNEDNSYYPSLIGFLQYKHIQYIMVIDYETSKCLVYCRHTLLKYTGKIRKISIRINEDGHISRTALFDALRDLNGLPETQFTGYFNNNRRDLELHKNLGEYKHLQNIIEDR